MDDPTADLIAQLERRFVAAADAERASGMSAYMRNLFPFYGIAMPAHRAIAGEVLHGRPAPTERELKRFVTDCWGWEQREWQYLGCDYARTYVHVASPRFLPTVKRLITNRSWWDTVDALAIHTVGPLVRSYPQLVPTMDRWIGDTNIWTARTAILHQLSYRSDTDAGRLFAYCTRRAGDTEFFLRKAIGWALREYSKTDAEAVRRFVHDNRERLSGLSQREALKWLARRPAS